MKLSLLETVQNILSRLDSDEVNSIEDTTESRQVSQIVRNAYYNILTRANLPEHQQLFSLVSSGSALQPVLMSRPTNVARIDWIKYDIATPASEDHFEYVTILPKQQFLDMTHHLDITDADVDSLTLNSIKYYFRNNRFPTYCTIVDDLYVIFDSYDIAVDTTLQTSKTICFGQIMPAFSMNDNFIPDIDEQQYPLLLNEATSMAFLELKQVAHDQAVLESRRQWRTLQKNKELSKESSFDRLPNFGRK